ncbi:hypothetical protein [Acaryochloris sp. IP29b_bin.137]|uniref:hypothetical protein n=1 Tax=Acaryochloris sp. IP29b_bin.137 TaxID=2969217 RepID=UPI0026130CCD|nr:hypothetical protein [Acaryochloris sp. IP29b_bin.137]
MTSQVAITLGRHSKQAAKELSVTPDNSFDTLDLLVPWDIPLECQLSEPEKQRIQQCLDQLVNAINAPTFIQALSQIETILSHLETPKTQLAKPSSTKTALSTEEVDDYDQYFRVNHVESHETALCLVRGLLTNCHRFMALCYQSPQLDPQQIDQQKQGFLCYVHLLTRVFNLE